MDQELYDEGPDHWTIWDLDGPTDECQMPEPIRPSDSAGVWHTCPHCHTRFILVETGGCRGVDNIWVNDSQHTQLWAAVDEMLTYEEGPFGEAWRERF